MRRSAALLIPSIPFLPLARCPPGTSRKAKRATLLIDRKGIIRKIFRDVKPEGHDQEVLADLRALG